MGDDDSSVFRLIKARHLEEEPGYLGRTMAGILPGEGRTLARHHRPETSEELLNVGPYPSAHGVAELQVIRPYAMGGDREGMGQHKTAPGGIDCDNRPRLL